MTEIELYGYSYSLKKHLLLVTGVLVALVGLASILGLTMLQILILVALFFVFIPRLILNSYLNMYEQKKFVDVSNYIEQMLYSFKQRSKILDALEDTALLFPDGTMGDTLREMIAYIHNGITYGNLYEEAFEMIEQEYGCEILRRIHTFMIRVEEVGGDYEASADILILDRNRWVSRVMATQKEKQLVGRNVTIGITLSLIVVVGTVFMVPRDLVDIQYNSIAQVSSLLTLATNFLLWTFVQCKLSSSWTNTNKQLSDVQIEKYYNRVVKPKYMKKSKQLVYSLITVLFTGVMYLTTQNIICCLASILCGYLWTTQVHRTNQLYKKRLRREVNKEFPDWMLGLSLMLQTDNVQMAVLNSIPSAPLVLRLELEILERKLEENPTAIEPYLEFYQMLQLPDVCSAMRMLYSMSQNGAQDMNKQIHALVERNSELQDQSEKLKTEDYLAGMGFCVLVPMLIGCGKLLVDMTLLMYGIFSSAQGFY